MGDYIPMCCGEKRTTSFCSACGKQMQAGSLVGLLAHVRSTLTSQYSRLADMKAQKEEAERLPTRHNAKWYDKQIPKQELLAAKWASWEKMLAEVVSEKGKE